MVRTAAASNPKRDRRRESRHLVALDARAGVVLLGEAGRSTFMARGTVQNISLNGACVYVESLEKGQDFLLATAGRNCWVFCKILNQTVISFLSGNIAWVEVHADDPEPNARLGINLLDTVPGERHNRTQYLDGLAEKSAVAARPKTAGRARGVLRDVSDRERI